MFILRLLVGAVVVLFLSIPYPASASLADPLQRVSASSLSCERTYSRAMFHTGARAALRDLTLTGREARQVRKFVRCQRSARSRRIVRVHWARYKRHWEARRQAASITPYPGPGGTRWSIPWPVVACESGGSWSAYNPSGAAGPYQIMAMHGRPFPVRSAADRLRHHQIAANLWRGGAGASHWVCKG